MPPIIYLKENFVLRSQKNALKRTGWKVFDIKGRNVNNIDNAEYEILRAIKFSWGISSARVKWTLNFVEDIEQWEDISQGMFVYVSDFDDILVKNIQLRDFITQHFSRLEMHYRAECLRDGDEGLKVYLWVWVFWEEPSAGAGVFPGACGDCG